MIRIYPKRTFQVRSLKTLKPTLSKVMIEINENIATLNQVERSPNENETLMKLKKFQKTIKKLYNAVDEFSNYKI